MEEETKGGTVHGAVHIFSFVVGFCTALYIFLFACFYLHVFWGWRRAYLYKYIHVCLVFVLI